MMISMLHWRAFGTRADLDFDFAGTYRNAIVTQLLAACRADDESDAATRARQAAGLTLAGRIGALAALVTRSTGRAAVSITVRCTDGTCRETFELELPVSWLLEQADQAERTRAIEIALADGTLLRLRRPTGEDQHAWAQRQYRSRAEAEQAMLQSLLDDHATNVLQQIDFIAAQLEDADPLPALRVRAVCPVCEQEADHPVDLEGVLLAQLRRAQSALLVDVHRLAMRYGWTEATVAALPAWRRRAYLELSAQEKR